MRAVVHTSYGPPEVLRLEDVAQPVPKDDEVLIRVHASTVNRTDCGFRQGKPFIVRFFSGLRRPRKRTLGSELAGEIAAVGVAVTQFAVGDHVFGVNADHFGAHAEFVCVAEDAPLASKPAAMSFAEAAAISDGGILALTCLRWAKLGAGQRILVYGASGSIGTAAVQLAKHLGADVTAVCATRSVDIVRSLGADAVIDYTVDDFATTGETYDVVFDAVGKTSFRRCRHLVRRGGVYVETDLGFLWQNPILMVLTSVVRRKRVLMPIPRYRQRDVVYLKELVEAGSYRAVVDRTYPLEQVVAATTYVETEQKVGNVVLTVSEADVG
jgi:NADPH:quinone reductase-like Zn-dependent oxidoreductase